MYGVRCLREIKTGRCCTEWGGYRPLASLSASLSEILGFRSSGVFGVFGCWKLYSSYQSSYPLFGSEEDGGNFVFVLPVWIVQMTVERLNGSDGVIDAVAALKLTC
jgi:hypothetical protein